MSASKIERLESRLRELAGEIKLEAHTATKAQRVAVLHALDAGGKLRLAHRLLERLRTKRRKANVGPPPSWQRWLKDKCDMSRTTAYYYMLLNRRKDEVAPHLNDPDVSIRKLVRFLADSLDDEEPGEGGRRKGPPEIDVYTYLVGVFRRELLTWRERPLEHLTNHPDAFRGFLDAVKSAAGRMALDRLEWGRSRGRVEINGLLCDDEDLLDALREEADLEDVDALATRRRRGHFHGLA